MGFRLHLRGNRRWGRGGDRGSEVRRQGYMSRMRPMEERWKPMEERQFSMVRIAERGVERMFGFKVRAF
ncbi:hypothetical protein OIU84_019510 [Salix udensis]|uniref:Uncharacterized protein n=1 Tax=Salix udensis TaxID=889485 RepID=A0AAD6PJP5_9ROSI|nr:hypothetical protein OIU84_019510 [Salix udensis]